MKSLLDHLVKLWVYLVSNGFPVCHVKGLSHGDAAAECCQNRPFFSDVPSFLGIFRTHCFGRKKPPTFPEEHSVEPESSPRVGGGP